MNIKFFLDDVPPAEVTRTISAMRPGQNYAKEDLITYFAERNWPQQKRYVSNTLGRMVDLGILRKDFTRIYSLTPLGEYCKRLVESGSDDFYNYMHYLHLHKALEPHSREYFWTYWLMCCYLGEHDGAWDGQQAAVFTMEKLMEKYSVDSLAIDKGSLNKMLRWLREMKPSPIRPQAKKISWLDEIAKHQLMLGLDFYYRLSGLAYGYPLLLTTDTRLALRRISFISDIALDNTLQLAAKSYDVRMNTGVAGVSVILDKPVRFEGLPL